MVVVTFAASGTGNCVLLAGRPYVFARTARGAFVLPAGCPHRGGPLNLAKPDPTGTRLICPWHERATSVTRHLTSGIPAVRRSEVVTAVFPEEADTPYELEHRPMSPELQAT